MWRAGWLLGIVVACAGATAAAAADAPKPGAEEPQQTTATFGDWTLRCNRMAEGQVCEVSEVVLRDGRAVAQIALGRVPHTRPLHLTLQAPADVSFATPASLIAGHEGGAVLAELAWRRCTPGGCFAEAALPDELVRRIREMADSSRLQYTDAAGRTVQLPFTPAGLPAALDALARNDGV